MKYEKRLKIEINLLKKELDDLISNSNTTDQLTIDKSQQLDSLISEYQRYVSLEKFKYNTYKNSI